MHEGHGRAAQRIWWKFSTREMIGEKPQVPEIQKDFHRRPTLERTQGYPAI